MLLETHDYVIEVFPEGSLFIQNKNNGSSEYTEWVDLSPEQQHSLRAAVQRIERLAADIARMR